MGFWLCLTSEVAYQAIYCDVCCFPVCFISWMPRIICEETTESKHMFNTKGLWNLWACCASSQCNSFIFLKRWWYTLSSGWQMTEHIWKTLSLGKTFCLFFDPCIASLFCVRGEKKQHWLNTSKKKRNHKRIRFDYEIVIANTKIIQHCIHSIKLGEAVLS